MTKRPSSLQAFTLIEMLVVLVIVAIITTVAVVTFAGRADGRQMKITGQMLQDLFVVASEQAALYPDILGVRFHGSGYRFYRFQSGGRMSSGLWQPLPNDRLSQETAFHSGILVRVLKAHHGPQRSNNNKAMQLIFYPNGLNAPVTLVITNKSKKPVYHLVLKSNGVTRLEKML